MKIVFMGTPSYAIPALEMVHKLYDVSLVVTQPDKKVGRKGEVVYSPVKQFALDNHIDIFQPISMKNDYQKILDIKPDIIITAAYGQMIPKAVLDAGISINLHGSLLPKYRGGAPVQYAIKNGDEETGVTLMYMAPKMDSGDIIAKAVVAIDPSDNTETLMAKLAIAASNLLRDQLPLILEGKNERFKQDESKVSFAYNIKPEEEILDFKQSTKDVMNHLRALLPSPGGSFFVNGIRIKVYEMQKSDIISHEQPGTILKVKKQLLIKTKDGVVSLIKIQPENKKIMKASDFLNGQKLLVEGDTVNK